MNRGSRCKSEGRGNWRGSLSAWRHWLRLAAGPELRSARRPQHQLHRSQQRARSPRRPKRQRCLARRPRRLCLHRLNLEHRRPSCLRRPLQLLPRPPRAPPAQGQACHAHLSPMPGIATSQANSAGPLTMGSEEWLAMVGQSFARTPTVGVGSHSLRATGRKSRPSHFAK
jgi:hypothetical protein